MCILSLLSLLVSLLFISLFSSHFLLPLLFLTTSLPPPLPPPLLCSPPLLSSRVFRTMFKEAQTPSPSSRKFISPMPRRRLPTVGGMVSPQGARKAAQAKSKLQFTRRKKSAQDFTRSTSPDPPAFYFNDDPRGVQIREQVRCGESEGEESK